ncbi:L-lactate MFS transporter [Scatolibacter rhodanostii]|uniref:L-lactate MFS transporter n=1 Tax=Scatolibacter rhodanostii TaxID=2014781 RepID=UPI000C0771EB|nr:MFS transporter [Scatolibacter rhodanostii]
MKQDSSKSYPRWLIFLGAWLTIFLLAVNATFSVLSSNVAEQKGLTLDSLTLAYALYLLTLSTVGIFAGRYADKHGCKLIVAVGAPICGLGWILTGMADSVLMFYLSFGVVTALGAGILYNALLTSTLKWFPDVRGKASGLLLSSASLGPFAMAPILNAGYHSLGVNKTLLFFGLAVIIIPLFFAVTQAQPPVGYKPKGWNPPEEKTQASASATTAQTTDLAPKQMVKTFHFYEMLFIFMAVACAGNMMIGVLYTISTVQIQLTTQVAALMVSVSTIMNFIGRLSFGTIYDKIGGTKSLILSFTLTIIALIIISFTGQGSEIAFYLAVAILGFAFGGPMVVFPPLTAKAFGSKNLGINYGIIFFGYSLAAFVGPKLATYFYATTGKFTTGYYISIVLALLGIAAVFHLNRSLNRNK